MNMNMGLQMEFVIARYFCHHPNLIYSLWQIGRLQVNPTTSISNAICNESTSQKKKINAATPALRANSVSVAQTNIMQQSQYYATVTIDKYLLDDAIALLKWSMGLLCADLCACDSTQNKSNGMNSGEHVQEANGKLRAQEAMFSFVIDCDTIFSLLCFALLFCLSIISVCASTMYFYLGYCNLSFLSPPNNIYSSIHCKHNLESMGHLIYRNNPSQIGFSSPDNFV